MNTCVSPPGKVDEYDLSQSDFDRIAKVAKSGWGLNLDSAKRPLIKSRLSKRLRALALPDFASYCDLIEAYDQTEISHFVMALTTNVTNFYRELHHFDYLEKDVIPDLLARAKEGARVRFWSAGCSSGQEPYSLAGSILSLDSNAAEYDLKILATDIDSLVLDKAQSGTYATDDCSFPSSAHEARIFSKAPEQGEMRKVRERLRSLISFRHLNLIDQWPISGRFDVIMCRNVAIYFDKPTQAQLWSRFKNCLVSDGHLFIGHSERISAPETLGLTVAGTTTYRLSASAEAGAGI